VSYGAVHTFPLVEPATGLMVGSAMWGNAILTRGRFQDVAVRGLPRAADDDVVEPAGTDHPLAGRRYADVEPGHREARCAVVGRFAGFGVATTHLTYIGREQRRRQAAAVADLASALPGPVIVTGDLNAPIDADEAAPLRHAFSDAFDAVGVPADDDRRRTSGDVAIDHVLVRGVEVVSCRVATEAGDRSDHWPVVADLRLPAARRLPGELPPRGGAQ
jgi:endonuclease/exonuclease/phosphatase family metal-dependent hydrolase